MELCKRVDSIVKTSTSAASMILGGTVKKVLVTLLHEGLGKTIFVPNLVMFGTQFIML